MTSDEIRKVEIKAEVEALVFDFPYEVERRKFRMLQEIAAQLAELNEHFRKADESVFGVKDRNAFGGVKTGSVYKEGSPQWLEERKQRKENL